MEFDAKKSHSRTAYLAFTSSLIDVAVAAIQAAKGDSVRIEAAIREYLNRGYAANLTSGELTDFFCVGTPSVLERAGYEGSDAKDVVDRFDKLQNQSHDVFETIVRLGYGKKMGVYLKPGCDHAKLMALQQSALRSLGQVLPDEVIRFFGLSDGCQINDAYFKKSQTVIDDLNRYTSDYVVFGEDGTASFLFTKSDRRFHIVVEGGSIEESESFQNFEQLLLKVMKEQSVI